MKKYFVLAIAIIVMGNQAFAWGQIGHRVVGKVAENHLSKKAKKQIEKIMGNESLAMASTWMDEIRSDDAYDHTHSWHWVSIPDDGDYASSEKNPKGDVVEAIDRMKEVLKNEEASLQDKKKALRFLVHLVGDLHQPLHVGNGTDKGGNDVKVKWFYEGSNLHRVWDSEIIDSKQLSYTELAENIDCATDDEIEALQKGSTADWANEAMQYRTQVYDIDDPERMGYVYMYENWDLVQEQLLKGGVRLAGILNEIFG